MSGAPLVTVVRHRGRSLGGIRPPRRVPDTIQGSPSSPQWIPGPVSNLQAGFGACSRSPRGDRHHDDERGSGNSFRPRPWFLQLPLPSGEILRRLATRNRPLTTERVRPTDPIQDGNAKLSPADSQEERLPRLDRPQGRLLPDFSPSLFQKAPSFCLERHGLPIQGSMFRTVDRPTGVHESFRGGFFLGSRSRNLPAAVPGRLADLVHLADQDQTTRRPTPLTLPLPRHSNKHGEVRPLPVQVRRIPRHDNKHSVCPSIPHRGPHTKIPLPGKELPTPTKPPGPTVASVVGTHVIVGEAGTPRETPDALPPVASEVQLDHRDRCPTPLGTPVPAGGQGHLLVDGDEPPARGDALRGNPHPHTHTQNSANTRALLSRGGEPTSSIIQHRDYGHPRRPHSTSTFWR